MKTISASLILYFTFSAVHAADIKDCSIFKKLSKDYVECQKYNVSVKSNEFGVVKKIDKFKKSKTLTDLFKKGNGQ
jgi:hypothetical protein